MEYAKTFESQGNQLLSIIHPAIGDGDVGLMIIVGGPQYRVGSHRQFVQLARAVANEGIAAMRFDYTGMGDSQGTRATFEHLDIDIKSAIDTFIEQQPQLKKIVLWGLCDAASAALMYAHQDERVTSLVLLNPWLRSDQAMGATMFKFYYINRLLSMSFWKKLLTGKVNVKASALEVKGFASNSIKKQSLSELSYQSRMLEGFNKFSGHICFILSGNDLTAKEFEQQAFSSNSWKKINSKACLIEKMPVADHTFSAAAWKQRVEQITLGFIRSSKHSK